MTILNRPGQQLMVVLIAMFLPIGAYLYRAHSHVKPVIQMLNENNIHETLKGLEILVVGGTEDVGSALVSSLNRRGSVVTTTGPYPPQEGLHWTRLVPKGVEYIQANLSTMRGALELSYKLEGRSFDTVVFASGFIPRPLIARKGEADEEDLESSYLSRFIILNELVRINGLHGRKRIFLLGYPGDDKMISRYEDQWFGWPDPMIIPPTVNTILFNDALIHEAAKRFPDLHVFGVNVGFLTRGGIKELPLSRKSISSLILETLLSLVIRTPHQLVEKSILPLIAAPELDSKYAVAYSSNLEELPMKQWFSQEKNRQRVWENSEYLVQKAGR